MFGPLTFLLCVHVATICFWHLAHDVHQMSWQSFFLGAQVLQANVRKLISLVSDILLKNTTCHHRPFLLWQKNQGAPGQVVTQPAVGLRSLSSSLSFENTGQDTVCGGGLPQCFLNNMLSAFEHCRRCLSCGRSGGGNHNSCARGFLP